MFALCIQIAASCYQRGDFSSMDSHKTTQITDVQITNTVETTRQCVQCTCGSYFPYSHTCWKINTHVNETHLGLKHLPIIQWHYTQSTTIMLLDCIFSQFTSEGGISFFVNLVWHILMQLNMLTIDLASAYEMLPFKTGPWTIWESVNTKWQSGAE